MNFPHVMHDGCSDDGDVCETNVAHKHFVCFWEETPSERVLAQMFWVEMDGSGLFSRTGCAASFAGQMGWLE